MMKNIPFQFFFALSLTLIIVVVDVETGRKTQLTHRGWNITPSWFDPKSLSVSPQLHLLTTTWGKIKAD